METGRGADANEPFLSGSAAEDEFIVDDSDALSDEPSQNPWHRKPSVSAWFAEFLPKPYLTIAFDWVIRSSGYCLFS